MGLEQGKQVPIQHTGQIRLPLLFQPDAQHMQKEQREANNTARPWCLPFVHRDGRGSIVKLGICAVDDVL
ncbi:hypothetical protein D3C81_1696070 [compost metagenome]